MFAWCLEKNERELFYPTVEYHRGKKIEQNIIYVIATIVIINNIKNI